MSITRLNPDSLHKHPAFTQVAVASNVARLVFVGGQNGVDVQGEVVGDDIASQSARAYQNVIAALEAAGATLDDVVSMTIYIVQGQSVQEGFEAVQRVQPPRLQPPTVSVVIVAGLANPRFLVEIQAIAAPGPGGAG